MPSLTHHLINHDTASLSRTIHHPFLKAAATASLPLSTIKTWLAQDRLYALTYLNFGGSLLSNLPIPTSSDREETWEWRCADLLIDCLANVRREVRMFEDTAASEGWLGEISDGVAATVQTRAYSDLFAGATAQGRPLIVGMVVLWATEECYLRSWKFAASRMDQGLRAREKDVMQRVFIPNWSCAEFEALVRRLGACVNKMANEMGVVEGTREWDMCEEAWRQVVWAERNFWPDVDESGSGKGGSGERKEGGERNDGEKKEGAGK